MNKIAKAIAVSLSTFITANATTVVHLGEENEYYGFNVEEKGNTYLIKQAYVFDNAPSGRVVLDIPGQLDGKQIEFAPKCFKNFGAAKLVATSLRFSRVNGVGARMPQDCGRFCECAISLRSVDFHNVDATANITDMSDMFYLSRNINKVDFGDLNTSNVTNMSGLFKCCHGLGEINYGNFATNNVTDMSFMFAGCCKLPREAMNNLNTQNVRNMRCMYRMAGFKTLNFGANFNTDNVTDMSGMFSANKELLEIDISRFHTDRVTDMSNMFEGCSRITALDLERCNTSELRNITGLIKNCSSLQDLRLPLQGFRQDIQGADNNIFEGCYSLSHNGKIKYQNGQVIDFGQMTADNINRLND
ncbi:MAG: BspA family leucine-rich repeat surface protein [Alphaproteobacteria bacterium]|nr:BspA family leucine-rich repeat surface protein [Alphaproteobacteria bacterium]